MYLHHKQNSLHSAFFVPIEIVLFLFFGLIFCKNIFPVVAV